MVWNCSGVKHQIKWLKLIPDWQSQLDKGDLLVLRWAQQASQEKKWKELSFTIFKQDHHPQCNSDLDITQQKEWMCFLDLVMSLTNIN